MYNHKTHYIIHMLWVWSDSETINNHFPSFFDNNVLEKVDSNRTLVEIAPDAVGQRSWFHAHHFTEKFMFHTIFECAP